MNDDIQDRLKEAERTFEGSPGTIEKGLDVDDAELVQLRRACRLLEVGSNLLDQGYYTVVIRGILKPLSVGCGPVGENRLHVL